MDYHTARIFGARQEKVIHFAYYPDAFPDLGTFKLGAHNAV